MLAGLEPWLGLACVLGLAKPLPKPAWAKRSPRIPSLTCARLSCPAVGLLCAFALVCLVCVRFRFGVCVVCVSSVLGLCSVRAMCWALREALASVLGGLCAGALLCVVGLCSLLLQLARHVSSHFICMHAFASSRRYVPVRAFSNMLFLSPILPVFSAVHEFTQFLIFLYSFYY